jgi:hypothetical protein
LVQFRRYGAGTDPEFAGSHGGGCAESVLS